VIRRATLIWLCAALTALWGGCDRDPYSILEFPDLGQLDGWAKYDGATDAADAFADDGCIKDPGGEVCDKKDNDCNGKVDDVAAAKLETNAKHCGKCYNTCAFPMAFSKCVKGTCLVDKCAAGFHDANGKKVDGCEYKCVETNGGVEICDNLDNDCDGVIDDGVNLSSDPKNCGACGHACLFAHGKGTCAKGKCKITSCDGGYKNLDGLGDNGCEYKCPVWPTKSPDGCDGLDSDCDGKVDEDFVAATCGTNVGLCAHGKTVCSGGTKVCKGGTVAAPETCNNKDDDCNGKIDDGFDKQGDPRYCGGCSPCKLPNAVAGCVKGVCTVAVCKPGYLDLDKKAYNGCEYGCVVSGVEVCDGLDNDCDGKVDTADSSLVKPAKSPCDPHGACKGAKYSCKGAAGWVCAYGKDVELKACKTSADCGGKTKCTGFVCPGVLASNETRCDGKDNDCDGVADETFLLKGKACAEAGKQGLCQGAGVWACNPTGKALICKITKPGKAPTHELCNGKDDDCDGKVDEEADDAKYKGVRDAMRQIKRSHGGKAYDFYIYTHEASRPDASAGSAGQLTSRACSTKGVRPWANVSWVRAVAACKAAGKRLCSPAEWSLACGGAPVTGPSGRPYPYGAKYVGGACNGKDYSSATDAVTACGAAAKCVSHDKVYDLSGNLREWTATAGAKAGDPEQTRGGAYDTIAQGLRCDFTFVTLPKSYYFPNLGFRCCSDKAP